MRNRGYVIAILVFAGLLTWFAVHLALGDSGLLFAMVPAALAIGCVVGAVKVAKAESFAPNSAARWDNTGGTANVKRWLKGKSDRQ